MSTPEPSRTVYDVQADLDLDAMLDDAVEDPKCEWRIRRSAGFAPCDAPATWIVVLSCGHSFYVDDEHLEANNRYFAEHSRVGCERRDAPFHTPYIRTIIASTHRIAS